MAMKEMRARVQAATRTRGGSDQGSDPETERWQILSRFMEQHGLKSTEQRSLIIDTFFGSKGHVAIGELHRTVRGKNPRIGYATVYRTLRMLTECGLAAERHFGDGQTRYEPNEADHHHDHLICKSCGLIVEFEDPEIERLQRIVAQSHGFAVNSHRHELYGFCPKCQKTHRKKDLFRHSG
jgi:Fur family ferric uptake transcriptional regulator